MNLEPSQVREAAENGVWDGRTRGKDCPDRYPMESPYFRPWHLALLTAVDTPSWSRDRIVGYVSGKVRKK